MQNNTGIFIFFGSRLKNGLDGLLFHDVMVLSVGDCVIALQSDVSDIVIPFLRMELVNGKCATQLVILLLGLLKLRWSNGAVSLIFSTA